MIDTKFLIGSLSNDLYRVASMIERGSLTGAKRFLEESHQWTQQLHDKPLKPYIQKILKDLEDNLDDISREKAEDYLMYSVILQNYTLHLKE